MVELHPMESDGKRRHLFISHHHEDDGEVSKLTKLLSGRGYDIRNSSIRAKPANQEKLDKGKIRPEVIQRLLRMKISWASTCVVLIGKDTHSRPWVNWEIEQAHRQNKPIVGIFTQGGTNNDIPDKLKEYGTARVAWNSESIIDAIDGASHPFEEPDGSQSPVSASAARSIC
jgi:MTH538 TIR-like domain (DUF1863)